MADPIVLGHSNETRAKYINEIVLLLHHQQIAKRTRNGVKERNASERGRKRRGESGAANGHKVTPVMKPMSDTVI